MIYFRIIAESRTWSTIAFGEEPKSTESELVEQRRHGIATGRFTVLACWRSKQLCWSEPGAVLKFPYHHGKAFMAEECWAE